MELIIKKVNKEKYEKDEASYIRKLYIDRRKKVEKLKFESARYVSIEAGLLLQDIVKKELDIKPEEIKVKYSKNGKPYIEGHDDFYFNISHSGEYVALVYGEKELGVDIEHLKIDNIRESDMRVAKRCFTMTELSYVEKYGVEGFFTIWTMKESYLKYTSQGISVPLNSFEVNPDEVAAYELIRSEETDEINREKLPVKFELLKKDDCIVCVCYHE